MRWGSPHAVLTSLLGVEGAHFFGALLQDFFIDKHKLCATLKNLDYQYTQKIASIILFDDVHSASAWRILNSFTHIPVEHMMTNG